MDRRPQARRLQAGSGDRTEDLGAVELVRAAKRIAVLTGAGISAESGIPTFRGDGGLWKTYRAEDLATPEAFARDPRLVWEWYESRRAHVAKAQPNAAHRALVDPRVTIVTQNIDGLHALAGSSRVLEIHGSIWRVRCAACGLKREERRVPLPQLPPRCTCESLLRPDIVWFGETLDPALLQDAFGAISRADVMLVIGTSGVVEPAASMGFHALEQGIPVIEINPDPTPLTRRATHALRGKAGDLVPPLFP